MILTVSEQGQVYFHTKVHILRILEATFKTIMLKVEELHFSSQFL